MDQLSPSIPLIRKHTDQEQECMQNKGARSTPLQTTLGLLSRPLDLSPLCLRLSQRCARQKLLSGLLYVNNFGRAQHFKAQLTSTKQ